MIFVIGSSSSAIAASFALVNRGLDVTMLDVGIEPKIDSIKPIKKDDPIKLARGSDYPYAEVRKNFKIIESKNVSCLPSFAQGGLTNVWGAFCENYSQENLKDWPINLADLQIHNQAIAEILKPTNTYQSSSQAQYLFSKWQKNSARLNKNGFSFSKPNLATNFTRCIYCGECQRGCPDDLIFSSRHQISKLKTYKNFKYLSDCVVNKIKESSNKVEISAYRLSDKSTLNFEATQVFVGCGPIISTKLIADALGLQYQKIVLKDSSHFLIPCVMTKRIDGASTEKLHSLTQISAKLQNSKISTKPINLQLYSFMDHYLDALGLLKNFKFLSERLIAIQGHLDSSDSNLFSFELIDDQIHLTELANPNTKKIVKKTADFLAKNFFDLGIFPLLPMVSISKIGRSFHYGGSFPMSSKNQKFASDIYGKPNGLERIHLIDASIFPSIAAGSITPTIMANAHRIASQCSIKS